jgi:short-subunit dehydrogenase
MTSWLSGKTILVTGASMGIGESLAREFSKAGAHLILTARSKKELQSLSVELQKTGRSCIYIPCDLSKPQEVQELAEKILELGPLDGIVHNAGLGLYGEFESIEDADIRYLFEVNFFSILSLTRLLLPLLKRSPQATVMMVSSVISWRAIPRLGPYCASKAALNLFTEALRIELRKYSIRLLMAYPGRTQTAFSINAKSTGWRPFSSETGGISADHVAKKLLRAFAKGKRDEFVSLGNRLLIWLNFLFPRIIDRGLERYFRKR